MDQCNHGEAFAPVGPVTASPVFDKKAAADIEASRFSTVMYITGERDTDEPQRPAGTLESRFANALNQGSPELIGGQTFNGCSYDGTFFSCPNPLTSIYRNLQHLFR